MRKSIAATVVAGSVLTGGAIGLTLFGPGTVGAKTGTTTTVPSSGANASKTDDHGRFGGPGFGRRHEGARGTAVAKAIGISETKLDQELRSGKTIAQVAKAHGVALQKVIDALVADAKTKIAAEVKLGRLTQAQADKLQTDLSTRITGLVNGTFRHGPGGPGFGFGGPGFGGGHEGARGAAVAKAIGISETDLAKELRSGKTVAQVAKAHGVAIQKVIDAVVADAKTKIAAEVKAGRLTPAQADKLQTDLQQRVTDSVNHLFRGGPEGRDGRPDGGPAGSDGPKFGLPHA